MKVPFFRSIRSKMATSFTLVIVFILCLALGLLATFLFLSNSERFGTNGYLMEISHQVAMRSWGLGLDKNEYQPEKAQELLEDWQKSGGVRLPSGGYIDTTLARFEDTSKVFVVDRDKKIIASLSDKPGYRIGDVYKPSDDDYNEKNMIEGLLERQNDSRFNSLLLNDQSILFFRPIGTSTENGWETRAIVVLNVEPAPPFSFKPFLRFLPFIAGILITIIVIVTPFGVIFGLIAGRGLNRRITNLAVASGKLAEGNFEAIPVDKSKDEIGMLNRQMRTMSERLQALMQSQQQLAAIEERNHLARELHDTVKQQNFATMMQIRAAHNLIETDPQSARHKLYEAETILKSSQDELGHIIRQLRPAALEDRGLPVVMRELIQNWCNYTQIPVQVNITNERRIPMEYEQALLRVAQEALSNIARHSKANMVWFSLDYQPTEIVMQLRDNGVGFTAKSRRGGGMGLQNMQERLEALGGWFGTSSVPGEGTTVIAKLPQ